jgi:hypothetical protein
MTRDEFIEKAKFKHGDKYDYSLVKADYKRGKDSVKIICPKHGVFEQLGESHLYGCGCNKCAIEFRAEKVRSNDSDFIKKAKIIHGDIYDYSLVNYKSAIKKVKIICNIHGTFEQRPNDHLNRHGCPHCGVETVAIKRTKNTEHFIEKANIEHHFKYDYSKSKYINNRSLICIICPNHGEFWQKANSHLNGLGCAKCSGSFMNTEYFIEKASIKHENKYNYSKVDYKRTDIEVCIICPEHGEFYQTPNNHLYGFGCPKCSGKFMNLEYFIELSNRQHEYKYDYSKVIYSGNEKKVLIMCPKHGEFLQSPHNHLIGQGCPTCNESFGERMVSKILSKYNVQFIREHKFVNCKKIYPLPFDFYLSEYNICVEYDGEQHYNPVKHFGGIKTYEELKIKDEIKTKYCLDNNIKLIRIPYTEFNNIEEIIKKELKL